MSKNKVWKVEESLFLSLITNYGTIASGATLPRPGVYPSEFPLIGPERRNPIRNEYYGMVITKPPNYPDKLVFGFSYFDKEDKHTDEDIYALDLSSRDLEYFSRGSYEKKNPLYAGTHKGIKDYLLPKKTK